MQSQKKAALGKSRDQLMDLMFSSKMKRANEVKVYKEFASVITFLDREKEDAALGVPVLTNEVSAPNEINHLSQLTPPIVEGKKRNNAHNPNQAGNEKRTVETVDAAEEKVHQKSNYWDKRFI